MFLSGERLVRQLWQERVEPGLGQGLEESIDQHWLFNREGVGAGTVVAITLAF